MQVTQPSAEQINAVITWADRMGRFWRRELHSAWMDGNYQGNRDISSGLQQVRNEFGPEWLVKFNLKAAKAAQVPLEQITGPVEECPVQTPAEAVRAAKALALVPSHLLPGLISVATSEPTQDLAPVYKIVQTIPNRGMVATLVPDIYAWAHAAGRAVYNAPTNKYLRIELQSAPRVQGLCGPMWDGLNQDGAAIIRYEDDATNDTLSR